MGRDRACDVRHSAEALKDVRNHEGSKSSEVAMKDDAADLDQTDEAHMTYDLPDEALEAAARVDGWLAITVGYCATASNAWYCLPY
jgi:hypothetical protein